MSYWNTGYNIMRLIKPKVLVFVDWFLPGFRAGGPIKSLETIINALSKEIHFDIITRDRDIQSNIPYPNIIVNEWSGFSEGVRICYLSPGIHFLKLISLTQNENYSAVYVNSFFSFQYSVKIRLMFLLGFIHASKFIVAPRGEMKASARAIKSLKKNIFLKFSGLFNFYRLAEWHSTSFLETTDIKNNFGFKTRVTELPNLSGNQINSHNIEIKKPYQLKIIFLSRIVPYKNLLFVLQILALSNISYGLIQFDIYGPKEDPAYWETCIQLIDRFNSENVSIKYCGAIPSIKVSETFAAYHLFFFPTLGENYGHVIAESLLAGTPVLLSNLTPWANLEESNAGWAFELNDHLKFVEIIKVMFKMDDDAYRSKVRSVFEYSKKNINDATLVENYIALLS